MPQPSPTSNEPNIRLPMAVRRQIERVNALSNPAAPEPSAPEADPSQNPDAPAPQAAPIDAPVAQAPAQPADVPAPFQAPPGKDGDAAYWKQRFSVVQGMLDQVRQERQGDRRASDARIVELQQEIQQLKQAQPQAAPTVDITEFFSPADIDQYGEEQLRTIATAAVKAATKQLSGVVEREIAPIRQREEQERADQEKRSQQDFILSLAGLVPDYQEVDAGDDWKLWLTQRDPVSRMQRQKLLNERVAERDAEGVADLFTQFKATQKPRAVPPVAPAGGPGHADGAPQSTPALGYPTNAEIRAHFKDRALGKLSKQAMDAFDARLKGRQAA